MVGEQELRKLAEYALSVSEAYQTEISIGISNSNMTRFANNIIHQNISKNSMGISVKSIIKDNNGFKIGVASGSVRDKKGIKKVVENSFNVAKEQIIDPHFKSLAGPQKYKSTDSYDKKIYDLNVVDKAKLLKPLLSGAKKEKATSSGIFHTAIGESVILNSEKLWVYDKYTSISFMTVIHKDTGAGYAQEVSYKYSDIDFDKIFNIAIKKAKESENPQEIKAEKYDVILEEEAVSDMLSFLSYLGLGGKQYQEGESFASNMIGKKIFGENITILDDPFRPDGIQTSFDDEGHPKEEITLVKNGVLKNVVYDTYTGGKYNKKSTGHSSGSNSWGPLPLNLILEPGDTNIEEMIRNTKKGILITRFHYTNVHHMKVLNMTGMTKDGTFLIEDGKVTKPLKNMRFTQSILEALNNVVEISKDQKLVEGVGLNIVPALKIKDFNFTSNTEH